jgi:short-subunit dehydrogenase
VRLDDAVVLVTGASGGIGAACASALASCGSSMIVSGRDPDRLAAVAADVGGKAVAADLARPGAADELAAAAQDVFGRVDAVVHCAGVGWRGPMAEMAADPVDELIAVNVRAPMQLTRALLPAMLARGRGHVAYLGSIAGWTGVREEAVYAATKAALIVFADSLRAELAGSGIGFSVVSPGAVATDFFATRGAPYERQFPRPLDVDQVAAAVVRGIERDRPHQMLPRWLAVAPAVRSSLPSLFRALQGRFG